MKQELKDCSYADYFYNAMFGYPLPRTNVAANQQPQNHQGITMTARNYCPAGDCDHLTKAAKAAEHGTPEEFEAAVWRNQGDGYMTAEEAVATIARYRAEYDAAP